jgi:hypothetical protein
MLALKVLIYKLLETLTVLIIMGTLSELLRSNLMYSVINYGTCISELLGLQTARIMLLRF